MGQIMHVENFKYDDVLRQSRRRAKQLVPFVCIPFGTTQKVEGRREKAEGRREKAEGRRQKVEGRRQKKEGGR